MTAPAMAVAVVTSHLGVLIGRRRGGRPARVFPLGGPSRGSGGRPRPAPAPGSCSSSCSAAYAWGQKRGSMISSGPWVTGFHLSLPPAVPSVVQPQGWPERAAPYGGCVGLAALAALGRLAGHGSRRGGR